MKLLKWLDDHFEKVVLAVLVGAIILVMLLQIVMRYCFNNSLVWSEELCRYCYIYFMFIGTALVVKEKSALRVDAIVSLLPETVQKVIEILVDIIVLVLCLVLFKESIPMVQALKATGAYSAGLHLPTWIVNLAVPIGFGLTVLRYIQSIILTVISMVKRGRGGDAEC